MTSPTPHGGAGGDPAQRYFEDRRKRGLRDDAGQTRAVEALQQLYDELLNTSARAPGFFDRLLRRKQPPVRGLYLWGGTGRGKTYLADLFFDSLPFAEKRRVHFHRFMQQIHAELKQLHGLPDPLSEVARRLSAQFRLLCLDEFHVNDIGDAMLLGGLLAALFEHGVTLVTTSNIPIGELYRNGLQRERFLPAIALLQQHTRELHLDGPTDYRLSFLQLGGTYHIPHNKQTELHLAIEFTQLAGDKGERDRVIDVNQRPIRTVAAADGIVWFDFMELCATARAAIDYLEIARCHHTLLLSDIRQMGENEDDIAKRFIDLIDTLYDHGVKLIVTAACEPADIYQGTRLAFPFQRTVSRLLEMRSREYLARAHRSD